VRISVLTQEGGCFGLKLLNLLRWHAIPVEQVVVFTDVWRRRLRWLRRTVRRLGWMGTAAYLVEWRLWSPFARQGPLWRDRALERDYGRLAGRVDRALLPRSPATTEALAAVVPDLCLLAQSGIVPPAVLAVPRIATLNAHPGVLPAYRGVDTELWAVYEGRFDQVGCTLHVVDAGVDTGPLLEVRPYLWVGDETIDRLLWRLNETCLDLLLDGCRAEWPGFLARAVPQGPGRLYHAFPPGLRAEVVRNLERFRAGLAGR
jgi:hypothetical protein